MKLYKILCRDVDEYNQNYEYEKDGIYIDKINAQKYCSAQNQDWKRCRVKEFDSID